MTAPETTPHDWGDNSICDQQRRHLTISDGLGGVLSLDLTTPDLDELAHACKTLLTGALPPGACLMRVWVGDETYLLRRMKSAPNSIGITRLGTQTQEVSLSEDVLLLVVGRLERTRCLRASAKSRASQRSDD